MQPEWLEGLLTWVRANPGLAGLTLAALSYLEGLAFIGIVVPGIFILFGFGALIGLGVLDLGVAWAWASAGAFLGDLTSYWVGHRYRDGLRDMLPTQGARDLLARGETFFVRHGAKGVIIGRMLGPVRPVVPVVAGMLSMPAKRYLPAAVFAALIWAPAYLLPGVVFGASIELARVVAMRLAVLLCLVVTLVGGLAWIVRLIYLSLAPRTARMLSFALRWSLAHPRLGRTARALVDPTQPESGSLALFALLLVIASLGMLGLTISIPVAGGPIVLDQSLLGFMNGLRTPWADPFMAWLSGLGHLAVLAPAFLVTLLWLGWRRRVFAAGHWIAAVGLGLVLSAVIGYVTGLARPPVVPDAAGQAVPLVHIGLSVVVYGFFAILIARELPRRTRTWPYVVAAVVIGLIALARLYFGAHWPSDLLVGILAGTVWITVLGIAYRTRIRRSFWTAPLAVVFFGTIGVCSVLHVALGGDATIAAYTPRPQPQAVTLADWEQSGWNPPAAEEKSVIFNSDPAVDFQYAGSLESLSRVLEREGWRVPRRATLAVAIEMVQPEPDYDSLPLLPLAWRGQREALALQSIDEERPEAQTVLRVWSAPAVLADGRPVFVVDIQPYTVDRVTWFFRYWRREQEDARSLATLLELLATSGFEVRAEDGSPRVTSAPDPAENG